RDGRAVAWVRLPPAPPPPSPRQIAWTSVVFPVPSSPESPITAGAASSRPSASPNRLSASADRRIGRAGGIAVGPQLEDLIPQHGSQLEVEVFGGGLHLTLEQLDERIALFGVGGAMEGRCSRLCGLRRRHPLPPTPLDL